LAKGTDTDEFVISYQWPAAFWEFDKRSSVQNAFLYDEALSEFSLEIEFAGNRKLQMIVLPLPSGGDDGLFVLDDTSGLYNRVEVSKEASGRSWKYIKHDVPPLTAITYCIWIKEGQR
jgi:hypothetical protein